MSDVDGMSIYEHVSPTLDQKDVRIVELEALLRISFDIEAPENAGYATYEEWVVALKEYQRGEGVSYERRGKKTL